MHYTKSIKGKYNYDLSKLLDNDLTAEKYDHNYVIKKGKTNKYLEELLQEINIDLDKCAIPDYN